MHPETIFILAVGIAVAVTLLAIRKNRKKRDAPGGKANHSTNDG